MDTSVKGFKIAAPWRDFTGKSQQLVGFLKNEYSEATQLSEDPNITRNMRGYYAFAWWRYEHSIHPMVPAVIVELGFLTNAGDRQIIVDKPEISAGALADGVVMFLQNEELIAH